MNRIEADGVAPVDFAVSDLSWIDDFFASVRAYLFFREEDSVLILPPNRVTSLNSTGSRLLRHMWRSGRIARFPGLADGERARDVNLFFSNLKAMYDGVLDNPDKALAVERRPFTFDFTALPILGEIAVTYRCNNRCLFCYAGCGPCGPGRQSAPGQSGAGRAGAPRANGRELSTRGLKRVIRIFRRDAKIPFFSFTGGEPLLRPDLEELISYARRQGLRTNLITNGTLVTAKRAASLARAGLESAQVSIESAEAVLHDRLTGAPGSFVRTLRGIGHLQEAGISVQTNTTVTALNAAAVARLPAFLESIGVRRFSMNLFIPVEEGGRTAELFHPYSEIGPVIDQVQGEATRLGLTFFWYSPVPHCHFNPIARGMGNKSCAAMDGLVSIAPNGDLLPCSSYSEPVGNLMRQPFRDIWFCERAAWFKQKRYAPAECAGCSRFTACQAACPLYWRWAGTGEIRNPSREAARAKEADPCQ